MVELTLTCLIVGHGAVISIKIDGGRQVHFLKKEIVEERIYDFPADELTLYLAKKNGAFLRSKDAVRYRLSKEDCPQDIKDSYMNAESFMDSPLRLHRFFDQNVQVEEIHVLVQLPGNALKRQKVPQDITRLYAEKLQDVEMSALTTSKKLEAFLSSPLPMKYPTNDNTLVDEWPEFFEHSEDRFIKPDVFHDALNRRFTFSDAESANLQWWDMLIRNPIEETASILNIPLLVGRNQIDQSTTEYAKRPDFLLWLNNVLVMNGVEKGPLELHKAKGEVIAKMTKMPLSVFGKMPFLFAYAAANSWVQFLVIDRSLNFNVISQQLNLTILQNRIRCVVLSINTCRILNHYQSLTPDGILPMYKQISSNTGSVTLYEDHLLKKLNQDPCDFESVRAIYDAVERNQIQCTVRCDYDRYARKFKLQPVGFTKLPVNDLELISALLCVARALVGLHALGYVHRDIRWPNILCLGGDSYILIDFENAGRNGDRMPDELLESRVLDPLVKSKDFGHVYRSCHDMYQFGELLDDASDSSLTQLRRNLMSDNVEERYTAEGALKFLFNLQKRVQDDH
ncbi:unnamed protein product [Albugo candida]|uniref:Crinkler effector protein N-terminal domain-containing protein n=1 Tax=Albugo candida TaxID=65357 RepID=A0A024GGM7_9STRA|nr:unnamed protein product [Albugo candida]|eukprot:CCI45850.1 unnamed protein product [Albugo candida]